MYSYGELLDFTFVAQGIFSFSYIISSLMVVTNYYAGFNAFLSGLIFASFINFAYYGIRKSPSRTIYGIILGVSVMLVFMSLQSAIFWGQYGHCESYWNHDSYADTLSPTLSPTMVPTYAPSAQPARLLSSQTQFHHRKLYGKVGIQCFHTRAMKSLCAFSVFLFLSYLVLIALLIQFKHEILGAQQLDEQILNFKGMLPPPMSAFFGENDRQNFDPESRSSFISRTAENRVSADL